MEILWVQHGRELPLALPREIGPLLANGSAFAGTPADATRFIAEQLEVSSANYFICDITFGDITLEEAMRSVDLLGREVLPSFGD